VPLGAIQAALSSNTSRRSITCHAPHFQLAEQVQHYQHPHVAAPPLALNFHGPAAPSRCKVTEFLLQMKATSFIKQCFVQLDQEDPPTRPSMCCWLLAEEVSREHPGWQVPLHVDAASGGFIAPFTYPELAWDFRLPWVKSINVSGHKSVLLLDSQSAPAVAAVVSGPDVQMSRHCYRAGLAPSFMCCTLRFQYLACRSFHLIGNRHKWVLPLLSCTTAAVMYAVLPLLSCRMLHCWTSCC
jgi:hypothetical protein